MVTDHEAWLKLTMEDPIDPELPICDAHHHLFETRRTRYMLKDLLEDIGGGHRIVKTVFVEIKANYRREGPPEMQPVGETEFVRTVGIASGQYGTTTVAAGIVGYADLRLGTAVSPVLEAHIAAGGGRFRGIRNLSCWREDVSSEAPAGTNPIMWSYLHPPKGLLMDPNFRKGFAFLQKYGLSFDACLFHPQLMELVDLARAFPDTSIILDHIGYPLGDGIYDGKRKEVFWEWKRGIAALAVCPLVTVKLGGLGVEFCGFGWNKQAKPPGSAELAKAMAPYFLWCVEQFGAERCMFESDFPPDKESYSYTVLWNAFKRITKEFSPAERASLFHDTAARVYRLQSNPKG